MNHMIIKDMSTGHAHEYGTNPHDSLIVSEDGRSLAYYNLQNGDGSRFGDYRFVGDDQEGYWNIGGVSIFVPERKKGKWIYGEHDTAMCDGYRCDKCGFFVPWDYRFTFIDFINDYHFCPGCGAKMGGEQE